MAISKMKKLFLATLRQDEERLMAALSWAGCVEITPCGEAFAGFAPESRQKGIAEVSVQQKKLGDALLILDGVLPPDRGLFKRKERLAQALFDAPDKTVEEALMLADNVAAVAAQKEALVSKTAALRREIEGLAPWCVCEESADRMFTRRTELLLGTLPASCPLFRLTAALNGSSPETQDGANKPSLEAKSGKDDKAPATVPLAAEVLPLSCDKAKQYLVICVLREDKEDCLARLTPLGFVWADPLPADFSFPEGVPHSFSAAKDTLAAQLAAAEEEEKACLDDLKGRAEDRRILRQAADFLSTKLLRLKAADRLGGSEHTLFLTGWVPEKALGRLEKTLAAFDCAWETEDPAPADDVPVLLSNKKIFTPFESVVEMYSLPAYGSFDPTPIMSVFYFFIFGLMLGDVVYGLILSVACFVALKKLDLGRGARNLISLFGVCGISCMISGVIFSGYLGNLPGQIASSAAGSNFAMPGIDLLTQDGIFIFIFLSLGMGVLQILTAMGIKFYMLCRKGEVFAAVFDVGSWYVIFLGGALSVLLSGVGQTIGIAVLVLGLAMKITTAGRAKKGIFGKITGGLLGLYDIVGYLSDLVSYMRIMALGLASAVIAYVVNILATLMISPGFSVGTLIGWILLPVILLAGHVINLALNLLGCFVHDGRLQYIEFFGRFFEDGGRPFAPLVPEANFHVIEREREEESD